MEKYIFENLTSSEARKVKKLLRMPVRNLSRCKGVIDYINNHGVYASMTSSPDRIRKSATVIANVLQSPYIRRFYVNIPHKYRNTDPYKKSDVNYLKRIDKRVYIRWLKKDIGPISKILPTLKGLRDKKAIAISFDDDVFYPPALINELIYHSVRYPKIIPGGAGFSFGDMEDFINRKLWPIRRRPRFPSVDVIEGWGGVAYRKEMMDIPFIKELNGLKTVCKLSDDLTISYSLAEHGVRKKVISNDYFAGNEDVLPLKYGLGIGALHQGSGTEHTDVGDANMVKYRDCLEIIDDYLDEYY